MLIISCDFDHQWEQPPRDAPLQPPRDHGQFSPPGRLAPNWSLDDPPELRGPHPDARGEPPKPNPRCAEEPRNRAVDAHRADNQAWRRTRWTRSSRCVADILMGWRGLGLGIAGKENVKETLTIARTYVYRCSLASGRNDWKGKGRDHTNTKPTSWLRRRRRRECGNDNITSVVKSQG